MTIYINILFLLLLQFNSVTPNNPIPQLGCNKQCITQNIHSRVLIRAKSSKCCGETLSLRLGTFHTLGIVDLQRQINLAFGYTTYLTFQYNSTHLYEPLSTDLQLINALTSKLATRIWFNNNNNNNNIQLRVPLVELTINIQQVPGELVGLALGGEHVKSYIWQLASRTSGDHLAKVDVRLDRILVGSNLTKEDVGIEIPRGLTIKSMYDGSSESSDSSSRTSMYIPSTSPISPDNVIVGILIDNYSKYLQQGLRWLISFQENIIKTSNSRIKVLVCILPGVSDVYKTYLQSTFSFIIIREIVPLSNNLPNATPHSNKLRFFEQPECNIKSILYQPLLHSRYQYCIYMDTDILILNNDLLSYINPNQSVRNLFVHFVLSFFFVV